MVVILDYFKTVNKLLYIVTQNILKTQYNSQYIFNYHNKNKKHYKQNKILNIVFNNINNYNNLIMIK